MTLAEFLVKAKVNTYASAGEGGETNLADGGKELIYSEGEWKYRDRYFGSVKFAGEEVVWKEGEAVWAMNYYGNQTDLKIPAADFSGFLKNALRQVRADRPFRGPLELIEGDWRYNNESEGSTADFHGQEKIFFEGRPVYELKYHGGDISRK